MKALKKLLDSKFDRVRHTKSAEWCGDDVWIVYTENNTINCADGIFIHRYDSENYILIHRSEASEETIVQDIFNYTIGDGNLRTLLDVETIKSYIWNICKHTHGKKDYEDLQNMSLSELNEVLLTIQN
jgi:hypothetical protein